MATTTITAPEPPATYKLELATAYGPIFRDVLTTPPRDCLPSEVPTIDLTPLFSSLPSDRSALAAAIRTAATTTGFFYIRNHGIPSPVIAAAKRQTEAFFAQPVSQKQKVHRSKSAHFSGWNDDRDGQISPSESRDHREGFSWRYAPQYDPDHPMALEDVPEEARKWIRGEEFVWEGTAHLHGFKEDMLAYWQECVRLARRLIRVFALALDLDEGYFDELVTYPGSDGVLNFYPASPSSAHTPADVGLGSHTDLQCFTLLWQDHVGGLQVLDSRGQWLKVPPVPDTFVVNIGDFLQRLSNDRFRSTVHRVYNHAPVDRYSMPFFFGLNFDERVGVLPSCVSGERPARYEPISCGEWCALRFAQTYARK